MTWGKAIPILAVAAVFDTLRYFFLSFWLFGPALAGAYCTAVASDTLATWTFGLLGTKTAAAACATGAAAAGSLLSAPLIIFGTVMGMAVGLFGWLIVTFAIFRTDKRVFGENPLAILWLGEGLGASVFIMTVGVYRTQIKKEAEVLEKYQKEHATAQIQERRARAAELMQLAQAAQQEADNETYAEAERAEEIPDELREAA